MPSIDIGPLRMFYESNGDGRPLLLIPGLSTDHSAWALTQVPAFTAAGYRAVSIDPRDAGQTDDSPAAHYSIRDMADDAAALLQRLDLCSVHVVGYSMGGMIAQELALNHADVVRSLTLCSTDAGQDPWLRVWLTSMSALRPKCDARDFCHLFNPWLFAPQFFAQPGADEFLFGAFCANPFPQSAPAFVRQCNAILTHDTVNRLGSIAVPTHVIVGAQDILTPPHRSTILAERIPGAKLTVLPHLGHVASWENPGLFNDAVLGFVRGVDEALPA